MIITITITIIITTRWGSINEEVFKLEHDSCPGTERYLEAHYKCRPDRG